MHTMARNSGAGTEKVPHRNPFLSMLGDLTGVEFVGVLEDVNFTTLANCNSFMKGIWLLRISQKEKHINAREEHTDNKFSRRISRYDWHHNTEIHLATIQLHILFPLQITTLQ